MYKSYVIHTFCQIGLYNRIHKKLICKKQVYSKVKKYGVTGLTEKCKMACIKVKNNYASSMNASFLLASSMEWEMPECPSCSERELNFW